MAITEAHAGRQYPPTPPYAISAEKIAEFARALGDDEPATTAVSDRSRRRPSPR